MWRNFFRFALLALRSAGPATVLVSLPAVAAEPDDLHEIGALEITILSTMLSEYGVGEWGFSAVIEADGYRVLFDTGAKPDTVLENAAMLDVDLAGIEDVILSHNHGDHTGGLVPLRRAFADRNPKALSRAHVAEGIFWTRLGRPAGYTQMAERKQAYEALGGNVIEYDKPAEIVPGVWLTGPVPRVHPEKNYGNPSRPGNSRRQVETPDGPAEDNIPESMSLVVNTAKGLVVVSGCGHAGMINILEYAQSIVRPAPVHAALGGFHLMHADDATLEWTARKLVDIGVENFVGAHCTGLEPAYRFRQLVNLERDHSVVGAVGAKFTLAAGIEPLSLAR